ncbi:DNA-dependent RNA polymerase subunit epsilon [Pseudalkalibacillus berkeleyi]|uniref:DNA-directed RNA polymerase subunit epsilon n=1 Tax=Pseudalkalibacillus berkeleyi TaxID=1069813 RepID=A0ABS9GVU4_9BACL|nr:DNA-directed RNA polymerase subunit epsilon [Pseudalkalibacillus berkeleyi]MCF6136933.1 DNA-dependent RNA polymerase auxiliary subunit epsilon family protein [Pseudalkalibacillus berkeleyi]
MIFKVFYQENLQEVPVREATKSLYMEADSVQAVRAKLADRNYNIEFVQSVTGSHLEYEQQSEDFELETR